MGYIDETLGSDEKILHPVEFHWIYMFTAFMSLLFLGIFLVGIVIFLTMTVRRYSTERALTNRRVVQKKGLIKRETESISLRTIEETSLSQSVMGRLLGYGSVRLAGTGRDEIILKDIDDPISFMKSLNDARL